MPLSRSWLNSLVDDSGAGLDGTVWNKHEIGLFHDVIDAALLPVETGKPHAPSHAQGGADPVNVLLLAGYPGGTTAFLRADGTFAAPPGGSGTPGGATTQVQFNNAGAFGGDAGLTYNAATDALTLGGELIFSANTNIRRNTADAADNGYLILTGAGGADPSRGAYLAICGNEYSALPGTVRFWLGAVAGSNFGVMRSIGSAAFLVHDNGTVACQSDITMNGWLRVGAAGVVATGSDSGVLYICGGSAGSQSVGSFMIVGGISSSLLGSTNLYLGNHASALFQVMRGDGNPAFKVGSAGGTTTAQYDFVVGGNSVLWGNLQFATNAAICRTTADGADNGHLYLSGGGGIDITRGAYIDITGNESGSGGSVIISFGNHPSSGLACWSGNGWQAFLINNQGGIVSNTTQPNGWTFNTSAVNGGAIAGHLNGTSFWWLGSAPYLGSAGATNDVALLANTPGAKLWLEASSGTVRSMTIYNDAASSGNTYMIVESDGRLRRLLSSRRYKTAIEPLRDWRWFLELAAVEFADIRAPEGRRAGGFLAEDVAAHSPMRNGVPLFAGLNADGIPEDVAYLPLVAVIQLGLKEFDRRLAALEQHP